MSPTTSNRLKRICSRLTEQLAYLDFTLSEDKDNDELSFFYYDLSAIIERMRTYLDT